MEKNVLNFTTHRVWELHVSCFATSTPGSGNWSSKNFKENKTPEEFYQEVLNFENSNRSEMYASDSRNVVYHYWVTESEIMTDNRKKYEHENQTSKKFLSETIPVTYVRGEIKTLEEFLSMSANDKLTRNEKEKLSNCIFVDLDFDEKNLKESELNTRIVMIPGEGKRETFFEDVKADAVIKVFPLDKLLPISLGRRQTV